MAAETNILGNVGVIIWEWWLMLLTSLDPMTANMPIAATITSLVFGVFFYIVARVILNKFGEHLGNDNNATIKWATFFLTVGFVLTMIYEGIIYLAAAMLGITVWLGVLLFGIFLIYLVYALSKKGLAATREIASGADIHPGRWAWESSKKLVRAGKEILDAHKEEKMKLYDELAELQLEKEEIEDLRSECSTYNKLIDFLKGVFSNWDRLSYDHKQNYLKFIIDKLSALNIDGDKTIKKFEGSKRRIQNKLIRLTNTVFNEIRESIDEEIEVANELINKARDKDNELVKRAKAYRKKLKELREDFIKLTKKDELNNKYFSNVDKTLRVYSGLRWRLIYDIRKVLLPALENAENKKVMGNVALNNILKNKRLILGKLSKLYNECVAVYKLLFDEVKKGHLEYLTSLKEEKYTSILNNYRGVLDELKKKLDLEKKETPNNNALKRGKKPWPRKKIR
jgi:hypothetical protein